MRMPPKYFDRKDFSGSKIQNLQRDIYVSMGYTSMGHTFISKKIPNC
jgi:hypothetical protein